MIVLALRVSVFCTVFGFGLDTTWQDMLYVVRRPVLLARALIVMFVVTPSIAIGLAMLFDFRHVVEVALVALSISPVPPLLPRREGQAGARAQFAVGLMAWLALLSIAVVPGALQVITHLAHRPLQMSAVAVGKTVFTTALAPLAAGTLVRWAYPARTRRLAAFVNNTAWVLLAGGLTVLLAANLAAIRALLGEGTLIAMTVFIASALAVGHLAGGSDPDHAVVLALSNASRHPAIALAIASANAPDEQFGATVLLYVLVNLALCAPYVIWQRRRMRKP